MLTNKSCSSIPTTDTTLRNTTKVLQSLGAQAKTKNTPTNQFLSQSSPINERTLSLQENLNSDLDDLDTILETAIQKWKPRLYNFGFAAQLQPYVGKGCKKLDYYFGVTLYNSSIPESKLFYLGLYWMETSGGITVLDSCDQSTSESFLFKDEYTNVLYLNSKTILQSWLDFKAKKLKDLNLTSELDSFFCDFNQIQTVLRKYDIYYQISLKFVDGFFIEQFIISQSTKEIGKISSHQGTCNIHESMSDDRIQVLIDFVEDVITNCGSIFTAYCWLQQALKNLPTNS